MGASKRSGRLPQTITLLPLSRTLQKQHDHRGRCEFWRIEQQKVQQLTAHLQPIEKWVAEGQRRSQPKIPRFHLLRHNIDDQWRHQLKIEVFRRSPLHHRHRRQHPEPSELQPQKPSRRQLENSASQNSQHLRYRTQPKKPDQNGWSLQFRRRRLKRQPQQQSYFHQRAEQSQPKFGYKVQTMGTSQYQRG